jgi:hypothetical protein
MKIVKMKCVCCGHEWFPHVEKPQKCPNCQTRKWQDGKKKPVKAAA